MVPSLIALSGYSQPSLPRERLEVGIHYYLLKPANPKYLKDLLAREIRTTAAFHVAGQGHHPSPGCGVPEAQRRKLSVAWPLSYA